MRTCQIHQQSIPEGTVLCTPRGIRRIATLLFLLAVGLSAAGADWPQFRGPDRTAVSPETGLLRQWPAGGPPLLWETRGLGTGFSSVAVVGSTLFTMGDLDEPTGKSQFIVAIDINGRRRLWTARVGPPHDDGPRCTPTVADGRVYALGTDGDLVCVQASSGRELWRKNLPRDFGGKMMSDWKYSESPLIDGEKLLCTPGGDDAALVALDRKTGQTIWKCAPPTRGMMGGAGYASIVVSEGAGVRQYITLMGKGAIGVKADDGAFLWAYPRIANGVANIATPVVHGDFVFLSTAYGTGSALLRLSMTAQGLKASEVYWLDANRFQCHHGGFLRVGDCIYGAHGHNSGNPVCIELASGKILWTQKQLGRGSGSLASADGLLFYRYEDDLMVLIEADPSACKVKGSFKLPSRPRMGGPGWAHPAIADGKLYVRHNDVLFCYDLRAR